MFRRLLHILCFTLIVVPARSQTGGDHVYEFLNLTSSGLIAALGGSNVSLQVPDLNMAYYNPALLKPEMNKCLALDYVNYLAGINYGTAMYSESSPGTGTFAVGLTYLNYGTFTGADAAGNITGTFKASEYAFSVIYSRTIDTLFSVGINFKPVLSYLEKYSSFGIAFDLGAGWHSRNNLLAAGITLKNLGCQITTYTGESHERLPFEIQAGFSGKLAYAPFRFSLTLRHLEKFDLTHDYYPYGVSESGEPGKPEIFENMMRHAIFGAELIPHRNFYICGGYNYQRRKEMQVESKVSSVGLSWGFGINTSLIDLQFARATYHLAGTSTHLSLIFKTENIYRKFRK
jgi:hypothetical protein